MDCLLLLLAVAVGYLSGSVNYAILVTRAVTGTDIRERGNRNPGSSNVLRTVGRGWGLLVGTLDALKGMVPLIFFRIFLYPDLSAPDMGCLYLVGIAAVVGHCRSVFHGFKGGGGIGTMLGVSLFFVPIEFLFSMLVGGLVAMRFFGGAEHKFSQWTPVMFVTLTPFVTLATSLLVDIPLFAHIRLGGHSWSVVAGAFALSFLLLWLNRSFMRRRSQEYQAIRRA
ncbi:MAG: glycerol-3-phosphate acyltransferase [Deltaproteobacteria bacterium]|nr:glycerol-3-phosphate acyltransferase [Deltaproteobacteria bacterium]